MLQVVVVTGTATTGTTPCLVQLVHSADITLDDIPAVREMGIAAVFGPGTPLHTAIDFVREHAPVRTDTA